MSRLVRIIALGAEAYQVELAFSAKTTAKSLPGYQVKAFIKNTIASSIVRYYNHRKQILLKYGGQLTDRKAMALANLEKLVVQHKQWKLEFLPRLILKMEADLYAIAPGTNSKFYENHSKLLANLMSWARYADLNKVYGRIEEKAAGSATC